MRAPDELTMLLRRMESTRRPEITPYLLHNFLMDLVEILVDNRPVAKPMRD